MLIIVIYLSAEKKFLNLQLTIKLLTFQLCFVWEVSDGFSTREISLNGNVRDFSVDYNSIDKSDIKHSQVFNNKE